MDMATLCCGPALDRAAMRRQRIAEAARILFIENGFTGTGVAQIAKASGVAVGQLYRDFEGKEDIVAEIVEGDCARLMSREALNQAIADGDVAAVWNWIRQLLQPNGCSRTEQLFAEIVAESARNERIAAIYTRARAEVNGSMLAALALLAPGKSLAARRAALADLILTQSMGLKQQRLLPGELDIGQLSETIFAMIKREIDALREHADVSEAA